MSSIDRNIAVLRGQKVVDACQYYGNDELWLRTEKYHYKFHHSQSCCESVTLVDVIGKLEYLIGKTIEVAEETVTTERPSWCTDFLFNRHSNDSNTWTEHRLLVLSESGWNEVIMRWFGSSNGYYGEDVQITETELESAKPTKQSKESKEMALDMALYTDWTQKKAAKTDWRQE